jgi:phospholipase/carboxylesterase
MSKLCVMIPGNGDALPASTAFRGDVYLFERGDIVRCHCRTRKDCHSREVSHANGERWLTETEWPQRLALHSDRSCRAVPLLILLHKAGGSPSGRFSGEGSYAHYADKGGFIILAPESPGLSWGTGPKNWGYDYVAINRALEEAFARCAIDRNRLAIGGFSDGASYALSLGLANGDVFRYIIAFSPGYIVRSGARGRSGPKGVEIPLVYIAHGTGDNVLPIGSTSRIFVNSLRKNGYNVKFNEFSGGHHVSRQVADQAMNWLTTAFHQHR